ncbi:MAG TPA: hypothetical protein VHG72_21835 [Polyangia bacterium]|nr:hypothetical protein [Polyangia bacterium]
MAALDFSIGQGDQGVAWTVPLFDLAGNPIDPTGGSVKLHYRIDDETADAVEVAGAVVVVTAGFPAEVQYVFQGSDTAAPGFYNADWLVTLASGEIVSYPALTGRQHMRFEVVAKP